jgi:hypothetical protein
VTMGDNKAPQGEHSLSKVPPPQSTEERVRLWELSLFQEAAESTLASASVFAVAEMRSLAHNNLISEEQAEEVLKLPMNGHRLRKLQEKHEGLIKSCNRHDFMENAEKYMKTHDMPVPVSFEVHYVGDENPESECVHYVGRSDYRKMILLAFRGSVTTSDWVQDLKLMIDKVPNPLHGVEGQPETVGIHMGFRKYTHGIPKKSSKAVSTMVSNVRNLSKSENGDDSARAESVQTSEYEEAPTKIQIVIQQLREMKEKYPDDPIFITGHSLGGALSLIAALAVAADPVLSKLPEDAPPDMVPVTVIAVANPKPGDRDFCNAILYLERTKKLTCCCIHNSWDVVPMLAINVARNDFGFWHPGLRLLLYKHRFELGRSEALTSEAQEYSRESCCCYCRGGKNRLKTSIWTLPAGFSPVKAAINMTQQRILTHDHREYLDRLLNQESRLEDIMLADYYRNIWNENSQNNAEADDDDDDNDSLSV